MEIVNEGSQRKKHACYFCIGFALPVVFIFTFIDILEGDTIETLLNILVAVVLLGCLYILRRAKNHLPIYRLILAILSLAFLSNVVVGAGNGTAFYWLSPFPPLFMFFLGKREGGLATAFFFFLSCILLIDPFSLGIYEYSFGASSRFLMALLVVILIAYGLESSREKSENLLYEKHRKLLEEKEKLQTALKEIRTLSGLIPICSNCKDIRNDEGYWQKVEDYVRNHTAARFSHGICPKCIKELYPDLNISINKKTANE